MASIVRPALLRQAKLAVASKRAFSNQSSALTTAISKPATSILSRPAVCSTFVKNNLGSTRIAAFHASQRWAILPAEPQVIEGTTNDPARVPPTDPTHGSYHWTFERLISAGLIPLTIAPFAAGSLNPLMDALFGALLLIHSHIGFGAMITDYLPTKRVPKTRKAAEWLLKAATLTVGVGLYEFETNDVGITEAVKRIWKA